LRIQVVRFWRDPIRRPPDMYPFRVSAASCAGFRACGFTVLSSAVSRIVLGTGKSPEPADKNVCATALNRYAPLKHWLATEKCPLGKW